MQVASPSVAPKPQYLEVEEVEEVLVVVVVVWGKLAKTAAASQSPRGKDSEPNRSKHLRMRFTS